MVLENIAQILALSKLLVIHDEKLCKYTILCDTKCMKSQIEGLKQEFLEHLEIEKGRSLHTIENYDRYLSRFLDFAKIKSVKQIDDSLIREYRLWLNRQTTETATGQATIKRKTQNYYLMQHWLP